jgi:hypothetical protein
VSVRATWTLGRTLQVMIACAAAASLVGDAWLYTRLRTGTFVLHTPGPREPYGPAYWTGTTVSGWVYLPGSITLAAEVVWLVWQHRATSQLWVRRYPNLQVSPGWAVGWWLIPVAWWFMPCIAMLELDRRSTPDGTSRRASPLIGLWWAAWLALSIVPLIGFVGAAVPALADLFDGLDETSTTLDLSATAHAVAPWFLVTGILQVVAGALAIAVVRRIEAGQQDMVAAPSGWMIPVPFRPDVVR